MMTEQIRNKYNTLTPAEAKKLNRVLSSNRQPVRTASVLRRPRAPPIVVTNLDNDIEKQLGVTSDTTSQRPVTNNHEDTLNGCDGLSQVSSTWGGSLRLTDDKRHNFDSGHRGALTSRLSLFSTTSSKNQAPRPVSQQLQRTYQPQPPHTSPQESLSNLSFRSSKDVPDNAYDPTYRFQAFSVDLGQQNRVRNTTQAYDTMRGRARYAPQRSNTLNYKFSDESFASAKSDLSARSSSVTPRSASKISLSSSTYKVFQNQLLNFKNLFRGIKKQQQQKSDNTLNDLSLSNSMSQLSLEKSQSPPICPPPPGELKSMSYLENSLNYSNYDYVYHERDLTTVFEEKQASTEPPGKTQAQVVNGFSRDPKTIDTEEIYQRLKPPTRFDDCNNQELPAAVEPSNNRDRVPSISSSHSLALSTTTESVLEFHRQQPATPYRFSFAQPLGDSNQINGTNYCDKRSISESTSIAPAGTTAAVSNAADKLSCSISDSGGYGNVSGLDHDADATILSETSTIENDSRATFYANKCADLERTVSSLRDKLLAKEKELTDVQLGQLNNDYTIERLRKQVSKLERENAQLKAHMSKSSNGIPATSITRVQV